MRNRKEISTEDLLYRFGGMAAIVFHDMKKHDLQGVKTSNRKHFDAFVGRVDDPVLNTGLTTLRTAGKALRERIKQAP